MSGTIDLSKSNRIVDMWRPEDFDAGTQGTNSWRSSLTQLCNLGNSNDYKDLLIPLSNLDVNENVYLLMEDGFPRISTQNQTSTPVDKGISRLENSTFGKLTGAATSAINIIGGAISGARGDTDYTGISWQPWIRNIEAWQNSRGIKTEYTFKFALGQYGLWNALEEVVKPILNLAAPCLPRYQGIAFAQGPWPNASTMLGKILGELVDSLVDVFKNIGTFENANLDPDPNSLGAWMTNLIAGSYEGFTWTMKFGNWMTFYHMLFENCTINFSNKVDENGWPIQGSIRISMAGVVPLALRANGQANLAAKFGTEG